MGGSIRVNGDIAEGLLKKRKLTQLVDWDAAAKFVDGLE